MKKIYLDNASTTPIKSEVLDIMTETLKLYIGNPSSLHQFGRKIRSIIEECRIKIANILGVYPSEIVFTSGGTESNNFILCSAVKYLNIKRIITSKLEHISVLNTIKELSFFKKTKIEFLKLKKNGVIDLEDLNRKLYNNSNDTLVCLMYANNEIGNIIDIENLINICIKYKVLLHSDLVQGIGYYNFNMSTFPLDFFSASAHKFYGPKGIGIAFIKKNLKLGSIIKGGNQEYGRRAGTENISGIVGLTKALELSYNYLSNNRKYLEYIKSYCISSLQKNFPKIFFNGLSHDMNNSIYTILSISLPKKDKFLSFKLDLRGIAISQGSACMGLNSHVIKSLYSKDIIKKKSILRISFGVFNKIEDIDYLILSLKYILEKYE